MNRFLIKITALLLIGIYITEIHMVIWFFYPKTAELTYSIWLDKEYKEKITVLWYINEVCKAIKDMIWCYAVARIVQLISYRLFKVFLVFFFYYLTQLAFYVWNRNTSILSNISVYCFMAWAIYRFRKTPNKGGKLINIEDY